MSPDIAIRLICPADAGPFLALRRRIDAETPYMMLEPGERVTTVEEQEREIETALLRDNHVTLVVEAGETLVGFVSAHGGRYRRNRHTVHVVVGLLEQYTGQGLGTRLFVAMEDWARQHAIQRLELTVMARNARGVALYRKMGFEIEGIARHALFIDGEWVDEFHMAKLL